MTTAQREEAARLRRILRQHQEQLTRDHARLAAVRAIHQPDEHRQACDGCGLTWPCNTFRALEER